MQMMFGKSDRVKAQVFCHAREFRDLGEHFLSGLGVAGDRAHAFALF